MVGSNHVKSESINSYSTAPSSTLVTNSLDSLASSSVNSHINNSSNLSINTTSISSMSSSSSSNPSTSSSHRYPSTGNSTPLHSSFSNPTNEADLVFPFCDDVEKYERVFKIGQGTFGEVFKARLKNHTPDKFVALKKVLMDNEKEGFPITALREIKILQLLKHDNVVNLIEICRSKIQQSKATFYLVFDFCEHDLAGLISNVNVKFSLAEIKKVIQQLLEGLFFIHSNKILHRDMKAANILITRQGVLKLADFGLARAISLVKENRYTNRVVTLWYRPPELLLGARNYGPPVDLWGAGCIMAEMWTRSPIMQGNNESSQLNLISQLCGTIAPDVWPKVEELDQYKKIDLPKGLKRRVKDRLKAYVKDPYALDLLDKLLTLDPNSRIDSDDALNHDFFWSDPMPKSLEEMLSRHKSSMFEYSVNRGRRVQPQGATRPPGPPKPVAPEGQFHDRVF